MMQSWSSWKRFPDVKGGDRVEAPVGPGVYEVRHTMTGRLMAFGHSGNVAHTIAELKLDGGGGPFARLFGREPLVSRVADLEYRTCAAASRADAQHRRATADGAAADRLAPAHGPGLGGASSGLSFMQ